MKIRSTLLFACLLVVPLLAMFSHKIPADVRQAARRHIWDPAQRSIISCFSSVTEPAAPTVMPASVVETPSPLLKIPAAALPGEAVGTIPADRKALEDQLADLGAFSLECMPTSGADGLHRCSCRVAADPSGQLQRVFQSSDRDPFAAMQQLVGQVRVWRQRLAAVQPTPTAPGPARRFQ